MSATRRMRGALPATFVIHALATVLAGVLALTAAVQLGAPAVSPGGTELLEAIHRSAKARGVVVALVACSALALWALATPLLSVAWLRAHEAPGVRAALAFASRRYFRALAVSMVSMIGLVPVAALGLLALLAHLLLDGPDARLHDLTVLAAALPCAVGLAAWATFTDLARAAVALDADSVRGALLSGRRALSARATLAYLVWLGLGALLTLTGAVFGVVFAPLALGAGQLLAFARALTRSRWLASAVERVHESRGDPPPITPES